MNDKANSENFEFNGAARLQRLVELNFTDQREQASITYPLNTIITVVILARMAGCNNSHTQRLFWNNNKTALKELLYGLGDEVPSEQTIRRVVCTLKTEETIRFLSEYFVSSRDNSLKPVGSVPLNQREVIAADGQNIRATRLSKKGNDARKSGGYDVVSLYSSTYGLTLCQQTVDKKNNEANAIEEMIERINLTNTILTWDALNTRQKTLKAVVDASADFVVCLKNNQEHLFDEVTDGFSFVDRDRFTGEILSSVRTESGHGRIETKVITIISTEDGLSKEMRRKWPHINSLIRVRTSRVYKSSLTEENNTEDRFFVSSIMIDGLDENFARTMRDIILARWLIESRLWVIDVSFEQDRLPLRNQDYIRNSTVYTIMACNVLSYIRDNVPLYNGKPWSFSSLQMIAEKPEFGFMFMKVTGY